MWDLLGRHFLTVLGIALGLLLIARILRQSQRPAVSFAWMMAIIFVPYIGVPAYLLFGGRKIAALFDEEQPPHLLDETNIDHHPSLLSSVVDNILTATGMLPARKGIAVEFLPDGDTTYARFMELVEDAERTIHVMTYILGRDAVGKEIVYALTRKAAEGVEVRLLLDAWGCLFSKGRFLKDFRKAGGRVGVFMPFLPVQRRWSANLRNHRKLIVVDGKVAVMGGMNMAGEYMGPTPRKDRWIDTAAVIRGPAALDLEEIFLNDWHFATGKRLEARGEDIDAGREPAGDAVGQVVASGPNIKGDPLYEAILTASYEAQERIWIVTPYFVPDEGLVRALRLQAKLGRDVRILVPTKSNHPFPDIARGRSLRELHEAGVRIYGYSGRMMHAKHLLFDDRIALVGSINFDMRSLYLNYEVVLFLYTPNEVQTVADWMSDLIDQSEEIGGKQAGVLRLLAEDVTLLVSPLL